MTTDNPDATAPDEHSGVSTESRHGGTEANLAGAESGPGYSIAAVSKLTGISCHTLRVWERRYHFPVPERSRAGHRRYSRGQVQALCHLTHLNRVSRRPIGELIAKWRAGELAGESGEASADHQREEELWVGLVNRLAAGDLSGADREYDSLAARLETLGLLNLVICPALTEAGDGWFRRNLAVHQERLISVFLRRKLHTLIEAASRTNRQPSRSVIIGTVQGDRHEGGVLAFALAMELKGWRVFNLGVDLPVQEYRLAMDRLHPSAVALSFVLSRNIKKRFQELERLRTVPVFVGGRSIVNYQSLARSHGLVPIVGSIGTSVDQLVVEFEHLSRLSEA